MSLNKLTKDSLSIGVELPLDNDWTTGGEQNRKLQMRQPGVPDMSNHASLIKLADQLGFRAAWIRDVPLYDPSFGDAAQVFEIFTYLGYLANLTDNILLGTAAVVLPLRQPWLVRKAAATVQVLSDNRLLLGVASGDRPIEYPIFNAEFDSRGKTFRDAVEIIRGDKDHSLLTGQALLPIAPLPPMLVAGMAQQQPAWIGENMDGNLAYPGTPDDHSRRSAMWRNVAGDKPYISFIHLDFTDNPDAPIQRHHFGVRTGRRGLIQELQAMKNAGVDHIGLQFRRNKRPLAETFEEIAEFVLPEFHSN